MRNALVITAVMVATIGKLTIGTEIKGTVEEIENKVSEAAGTLCLAEIHDGEAGPYNVFTDPIGQPIAKEVQVVPKQASTGKGITSKDIRQYLRGRSTVKGFERQQTLYRYSKD